MIVALASALALVFGIAVVGKLHPAGFREFRRSVGELWFGPGTLPSAGRHGLAVLLLVVELGVAVVLTSEAVLALAERPWWTAVGFAAAVLLLVAFTTVHAMAIARNQAVPCACFGRASTIIGVPALVRSIILLSLAITGLVLSLFTTAGSDPSMAVLAAPAGLVLGLLLIGLEDLVVLIRPTKLPIRSGLRT